MTRIAIPVPTASLVQLFAKWPPPWSITKRWELRVTGGLGVEIRDVNHGHVVDCESTLGEGLIAAVHSLYVLGLPAIDDEPATTSLVTAQPETPPWRGQEVAEPFTEEIA
jgi:hypothetical protein